MPANRHFRLFLTPSPGAAVRGFTLIELLVVLTISAILLAVGVPIFQTSIANMRATDAANSLVASIELARSEAIKRGEQVFACRVESATATACAAAGGDWAAGWIVWSDVPNTGTADVPNEIDDNDRLQIQGALGSAGQRAEVTLSAGNRLTFFPDGRVTPAVNFSVGYPTVAAAQAARCVRITGVGSISTARGAC